MILKLSFCLLKNNFLLGDFSKNRRRDRTSTSEESDFFSLKRQNKYSKSQNINLLAANQNRNSSSGKQKNFIRNLNNFFINIFIYPHDGIEYFIFHSFKHNFVLGYVSCSECSYDSDTCTCVSADKCYCSLGQRNFESSRRSSVRKFQYRFNNLGGRLSRSCHAFQMIDKYLIQV